MAKKHTQPEEFRTGEKVVASTAMPDIPEGTPGEVTFVAGFTWIRYWVRFANGVMRGSLNRKNLARPEEWREIQARRARGDDEPAAAATGGEPVAAAVGGDGDAGSTADRVIGGVAVPGHLLDRSKSRRAALGR